MVSIIIDLKKLGYVVYAVSTIFNLLFSFI